MHRSDKDLAGVSRRLNRPRVSVVITSYKRPIQAVRAVRSAWKQDFASFEVIVVEDGCRTELSETLFREFGDSVMIICHLNNLGLAAARNSGAGIARGRLITFLDDDDYLLPNSCRHRLEVFEQHPEADVVATNGYLDADGQRVRHLPNILQSRSDPLLGMFREMWLGSASGMFRTETIGPDLFDLPFRYFEWTVTSFVIAENYHVILEDTATYVIEQ